MPFVPVQQRSIFTDKGPIAKPPLTLLQGGALSFTSTDTVAVAGGVFSAALVGRYLRVTGSAKNDGEYLILSVPSANSLRVQGCFSRPDSATAWSVYDARTGQIADDPTHVTVRVNGTPVVPETVIGLLGQIVLPDQHNQNDVVEVDYSWVQNPTVDVTRLNSREFKLNNWNREDGRPMGGTGHLYRYNNVLVQPSLYMPARTIQQGTGVTLVSTEEISLGSANLPTSFVGLTLRLTGTSPAQHYRVEEILSATSVRVSPPSLAGTYTDWAILDETPTPFTSLAQPQSRELHYRAYERAYTAALNDPNLLVLNTPLHRIAYPPLQRPVTSESATYLPTTLPDGYPLSSWEQVGQGNAYLEDFELVLQATTAGTFPAGSPFFWRRPLDQTFPHAYALAWRMWVEATPTLQGVWTGIGAGYSTEKRAVLLGYLNVGGTRKIGFLRKGYENDPSSVDAWVGGWTPQGSTGLPVSFDWSVPHSYRLFRSRDGVVRLYVDGEVVETLRVYEDDLPFLEGVVAPFQELQQVFWGSLSSEVQNKSRWSFVRSLVLPTNPYQITPSVYVSYEANQTPENATPTWTPVGYHGYEVIRESNYLLLGSTSATTQATEDKTGLIGGDFRGYTRIEPLLSAASELTLDFSVRGLTQTHGVTPNALMVAADDGNLLCQVSFLTGKQAPKLGYGGRSLPTEWSPTPWSAIGVGSAQMVGRTLRLTDSLTNNGLIYYVDDTASPTSDARVLLSTANYMLEFRCHVRQYTADVAGFSGVSSDVYDGSRTLGVMLVDGLTGRQVALHSDGVVKATFPFEWFDGAPHTYRMVKSDDVVSVYADDDFLGLLPYADFSAPVGGTLTGTVSFGSATPSSVGATSTVDWVYVNSWRVWPNQDYYVGIWKGRDPDSLLGYHLPLKCRGENYRAVGQTLISSMPLPAGITAGDPLIIDEGPNKGVYTVVNTQNLTDIVLDRPLSLQPSLESFRIPVKTDWSQPHSYRLMRIPTGAVTLSIETDTQPLLSLTYTANDLPSSSLGISRLIAGGLPSVTWGAFDPTNLSTSSWDYVHYGMTRVPSELRLVPHHQHLNQRNVIASSEHLRSNIPHSHTGFWSSSTGIPPQTDPDVLANPALVAYTQLNDTTPLVPRTQTAEVRQLTPIRQFLSALNRVEDVMNSDGDFRFNDGTTRWQLFVPDDVLYNSLQVIEQMTGEPNLLAPFDDNVGPTHLSLEWQKKVCLDYQATTLPEQASGQSTPWRLVTDNPDRVLTGVALGVLSFGTDTLGTRAVYRNPTPLPDAPSLSTTVRFRMKVRQDGTYGLGDSQIRLGFSAIGMTLALAFRTLSSGQRYVHVVDLNNGRVLGGIRFDYLDGAFHTYQIVKNPTQQTVTVTVVN